MSRAWTRAGGWIGAAALSVAAGALLGFGAEAKADITELWTKVLPGNPQVFRMATNGDVLVGGSKVVGTIFGIPTNPAIYDSWLVRLNPAGDIVWQWQSNTDLSDFLYDIAFFSDGDIAVAIGSSSSVLSPDADDIRTLRLDASTGASVWERTYSGGPYIADASPTGIAVGPGDAVVVIGTDYPVIGNEVDAVVLRYDAAGNQQWLKHIGGPSVWDVLGTVMIDPTGRIIVGGSIRGATGSIDFAVIAIDPSGSTQWTYTRNGSGNVGDGVYDMQLDSQGSIVAAGMINNTASVDDAYVVKLSPGGSKLWEKVWNGSANLWDRAYAVAIGPQDQVYLTGETFMGFSFEDFNIQTIAISASGTQLWQHVYGSQPIGYAEDIGAGIRVLPSGDVVRLGYDDTKPGPDYILHRFSPSGQVLDAVEGDVPGGDVRFSGNNFLVDPTGRYAYMSGWGVGFPVPLGLWSSVIVKVDLDAAGTCYADCDGSTALNIFDYICFGNRYQAKDPYADCDGSGGFTIFDYICFGDAFAQGCP